MHSEPNVYSRTWFDFFHTGIDEARTKRETGFICQNAPLPDFRRILDVCCGMGRHSRALAGCGYAVTGIDRDANAIDQARHLDGRPCFMVADIRDFNPNERPFDAAIVMGQSFGHFDSETNREVLKKLKMRVRKGGRIILDLWNPDFFVSRQGDRALEISRGTVRETKRVVSDRLFVQLQYPDGTEERFEWQLLTPGQMRDLAHAVDLEVLATYTGFAPGELVSPNDPRIQFVLQTP